MSSNAKKKRSEMVDDEDYTLIPGEITIRTQAAVNLVKAAKAMGILDRLLLVLSHVCGKLGGESTDSPRPGERRVCEWRGKNHSGCLVLTDTEESGESSSLDQMGDKLWSRFKQKRKQQQQ